MNQQHWTCLINEHPKLNRYDVEVIIQNIEAQPGETWNNKTAAKAAHVHTATENEDTVNKALMSIMNKPQKLMHQQAHLPEGNFSHYVPLHMRNQVAPTPKRKLQLNKCKVLQRCLYQRTHKVPMKGIIDCNMLLTVPNGQQISLT